MERIHVGESQPGHGVGLVLKVEREPSKLAILPKGLTPVLTGLRPFFLCA